MKNLISSFVHFILNHIVAHIPFWCFREFSLKITGVKIGKGSVINMNQYILSPNKLSIGEYSHINQGCFIDCRGGVTVYNNVSISHYVRIVTGSHDMNSVDFDYRGEPIVIEDFAWIGIGVTILQGVKIGRGAVVCAGAVVTKDVEDFSVVAGIPAKQIGTRKSEFDYKCCPKEFFV